MAKLVLGIFTTSLCNLSCKNCSLQDMMRAYPGFQWSLEDVDRFIYYTKLSGYKYDNICLSGGEPLLWTHVIDGSKMIKEAGMTKLLTMESNGLVISENNLDLLVNVLENVDRVRFSLYTKNKENIKLIQKKFPKKKGLKRGVFVVDKVVHRVLPTRHYPNTLPVKCRCPNYYLKGTTVQICGGINELIFHFGWDKKNYSKFFENLKNGYLERLNKINRKNQKHCEYCLINGPIWRQLKVEKH